MKTWKQNSPTYAYVKQTIIIAPDFIIIKVLMGN